jgi:hypothetical protein
MKYLLIFFMLLGEVFAACHAMGPAATGSGTGTDWSNIQAVPTSWTLTRGDTYYLRDGTYAPVTFVNVSGTTTSTILKATASDFGSGCSPSIGGGWNVGTMGSGVATFTGGANIWTIQSHHLFFDGITGAGKTGHGIRLNGSSTTDGAAAILVSANGNNITYRHIEANNGPALSSNGSRVYHSGSVTSSNDTFQYVYFHGGRMWIGMVAGGTSNQLVEHSYFANAGSGDPALHSAGMGLADVTTMVIRYNVFENMLGGSNTTYIEPQFNPSGIDLYGNVFWGTSSNESTGQGIFAITSTDTCTNCKIYNNTIVGLHTFSGIWCGNTGGQSITVDNNVWNDNPASPDIVGQSGAVCTDGGHNTLTNSGTSFVNEAGGNFHLASNTAAWGTLASPYNVDPDGVTRTSSRGAYQFGSPIPPAPPSNVTATVN